LVAQSGQDGHNAFFLISERISLPNQLLDDGFHISEGVWSAQRRWPMGRLDASRRAIHHRAAAATPDARGYFAYERLSALCGSLQPDHQAAVEAPSDCSFNATNLADVGDDALTDLGFRIRGSDDDAPWRNIDRRAGIFATVAKRIPTGQREIDALVTTMLVWLLIMARLGGNMGHGR
jgi:hypothetical protein